METLSLRMFFSRNTNVLWKNGDITGTLNGNEKDYLIVVKAQNGDSNITDNVIESSKSIEFNVENGNVNIDFSE